MGNQQSNAEVVSELVNKSVANVMMEASSKCSANNVAVQTLEFKDIKLDPNSGCNLAFTEITQEQKQMPNFSCINSTEMNSEIASKIANDIAQQAAAQTSGLAGALNSGSNAKSLSKITNDITANVNMKSLSECVQNTLSDQKLLFQNLSSGCPFYCKNVNGCPKGNNCDFDKCTIPFNKIKQIGTQSAVTNCLNMNAQIAKEIKDLDNKLKQDASAKNTGIDLFASIGASVICLIIIVILIFFLLK
jgi:hypothetical protein